MHIEFENFLPAKSDAELVILAGDIWKQDKGIRWAKETWQQTPVIYVAGNHEFYDAERNDTLAKLRSSAERNNIHFLENDEVIIAGTRFLGCTLWTDFELFGATHNKNEVMEACRIGLADFNKIVESIQPFTPGDANTLFNNSAAWLEQKLINERFDGKTVVITHHLPSFLSVEPQYSSAVTSSGFASNLDRLLGYSDMWIHGHAHSSSDYYTKGTRVICNPRGYIVNGQAENTSFNPELIVEL